jgi:NAD(P)-dependent dehydrogenase (short-subunit alcohol dehydrogenase family)
VAIALITGTSSGIGLATAVTLARGGHRVIATMRNLDGAGELRRIVSAERLPITLASLNVDDDASVTDTVNKVQTRRLFLKQETADPDVAQVSLSKATDILEKALHDIAKLAKEMEKRKPARAARRLLDARVAPVWSLALDEIFAGGDELAPRLPFAGPHDFTGPERTPRALAKTAPLLSSILRPIMLDPLTVADDTTVLDRIAAQPNIPGPLKTDLAGLY